MAGGVSLCRLPASTSHRGSRRNPWSWRPFVPRRSRGPPDGPGTFNEWRRPQRRSPVPPCRSVSARSLTVRLHRRTPQFRKLWRCDLDAHGELFPCSGWCGCVRHAGPWSPNVTARPASTACCAGTRDPVHGRISCDQLFFLFMSAHSFPSPTSFLGRSGLDERPTGLPSFLVCVPVSSQPKSASLLRRESQSAPGNRIIPRVFACWFGQGSAIKIGTVPESQRGAGVAAETEKGGGRDRNQSWRPMRRGCERTRLESKRLHLNHFLFRLHGTFTFFLTVTSASAIAKSRRTRGPDQLRHALRQGSPGGQTPRNPTAGGWL